MFARSNTTPETATEPDVALVTRALGGLDPWSFWVVPAPLGGAVDLSVVGTTGAFAISICALEGNVRTSPHRIVVGDRSFSGVRSLKRAARKISTRLRTAAADAPVLPMVCLTRALCGGPRTVRGIRVVRPDDLVREIARRNKVLQGPRARKGANALGDVRSRSASRGPGWA